MLSGDCAADRLRDQRHQRRVQPLTDDPTIMPELPVEWIGGVTGSLSLLVSIEQTCSCHVAVPCHSLRCLYTKWLH